MRFAWERLAKLKLKDAGMTTDGDPRKCHCDSTGTRSATATNGPLRLMRAGRHVQA